MIRFSAVATLISFAFLAAPTASHAQDRSGDGRGNRADKNQSDVPGAPQLFPQDTLAYIRFSNIDQIRSDWPNTSFGRMLDDPQLAPFVADTGGMFATLFDDQAAFLGVSLEELLSIPTGQVAIAAMPARFDPERLAEYEAETREGESEEDAIRRRIRQKRRQQTGISALFLIEAGGNIDRLQQVYDRIEERALEDNLIKRTETVGGIQLTRLLPPRGNRQPVEMFVRDGTMVVGIGHETATLLLKQWNDETDEPTLAERPQFISLMSRCLGAEETRPQVTVFADPYHFIERIVKGNGGGAALVWPIIESLGLKRLSGIAISSFRGGDTFEDITHMHVGIEPPRDGFFGVVRPDTGPVTPPSFVPADVVSYSTLNWRYDVTYENLEKIVVQFASGRSFDEIFETPVKTRTGISIKDDVLPILTGRSVFCRYLVKPVKFDSMVPVFALEVTSDAAATKLLTQLRDRFEGFVEVDSYAGVTLYKSTRNRDASDFSRGNQPTVWVKDGYVFYCGESSVVETFIQTSGGSGSRLAESLDFEIVGGELSGMVGSEEPFFVSFVRGAEFLRQGYEMLKSENIRRAMVNSNNDLFKRMAETIERNELPDFDELEQYFAPAGGYAYDEPGGLHWTSYTLRSDDD